MLYIIRIFIVIIMWISLYIFIYKKYISDNSKDHDDKNKNNSIRYTRKKTENKKEPILNELIERIRPMTYIKYEGLLSPLNKDLISSIELKVDDKESFTINKRTIHMCVYDENGKYYHINNLMFVFLHELAHCICDEEGHTEKFGEIFEELLRVASSKGIYDPMIPMTSNYCSYKM